MSRNQLLILITCAVIIGVVIYVNSREKLTYEIPPPMAADEISACPDTTLLTKSANHLRFRIAEHPDRWRSLDPAAVTVLALSWVEDELPDLAPTHVFSGFAAFVKTPQPNKPTLDELASAYDAIGAPDAAAAVRAAKSTADAAAGQE